MTGTNASASATSIPHEPHAAHGTKAIVAALLANSGIAIAKFIGFLLTRSASMLAESVHSLADSANQGLLLLGAKQAKRDQDERHQFGYGMVRYFWSFVVALILFSLGSLFALYEGVSKLRHPHHLDSPGIAVAILSVAVVLEAFSFRTAVVESRPLKGDQSWWSFIRNAKVPELPVVLLEDTGALVGLLLALGGVGMAQITDNSNWDAYSTISIGVLLGIIAVILIVEMRSLLLGESASARDADALQSAIQSSPHVRHLIHARTMHIGPDSVLVGAKIELDPSLSFEQVTEAIDETEARIRAAVPTAHVIYLEPAIFNPSRKDGA